MKAFLLTSFTLLASIGLLNYEVNPEGIYSTRRFPPILWGSRPSKAHLLLQAAPPPQSLILGSSRVMNLVPADFQHATGLVTFNAGVDLAKPEDFYVLLRYAVEQAHLTPRLIFIGVDVETFHDHEPPHSYLQQPTELGRLMPGSNPYWRWHSFTRLFTQFETGLSLTSLQKLATGETTPAVRLDADGRAHFDEKERLRQSGAALPLLIQGTVARMAPRYDDYSGLSQSRIKSFADTLSYARSHNIQVITFLTPTHPDIEQGLARHGYHERQLEVTSAMQQFSREWKVPFLDLSDATQLGGSLSSFYDGVHYDDSLAHRIAARLTASVGAVPEEPLALQ